MWQLGRVKGVAEGWMVGERIKPNAEDRAVAIAVRHSGAPPQQQAIPPHLHLSVYRMPLHP